MLLRSTLLSLTLLLLRPVYVAGAEETANLSAALPRRCGVCHLERLPSDQTGPFNFLSLGTPSGAGEEKMCYSCHNGPVRDSRRGIWTGRQHRSKGTSGTPAPGARASCGSCHDPHVKTAGASSFMKYEKGHTAHCVTCHPRGGQSRGSNHPVSSGISAAGEEGLPGCFSCHAVHSAAGPSLIRRGASDVLCASCHGENPSAEGRGPGASSHPVSGDSPTCTVCHEVHDAPEGMLLLKEAATGAVCGECHGDRSSPRYEDGNHPSGFAGVGCLSCHRAHNAAALDGRNVLLAEPPGSLDSICGGCHGASPGGEDGWNHPVQVQLRESNRSRIPKFSAYGGLLGEGFMVQCVSCHKAHGSVGGTAGLVVSPQALCLYCHSEQNSLAPKDAASGTHPVSAKPEKADIAEVFLAAGGLAGPRGEVVCLTCHRGHGGDRGLVLPRGEYSCMLCHGSRDGFSATPHGRPAAESPPGAAAAPADPCQECHFTHGWRAAPEESGMGGSAVETVCWYCHGPEGEVPMRGYFGHVLGAPPTRGTGGRDLPLFLSDGRRYKGGVITCATCHDVHRETGKHSLRLEPGEERSALCLGCHPRKAAVSGTKHDLPRFFPGEENRLGETAEETGTCGACHLAHSSGLGDSWAREVEAGPAQAGILFPFCATCHAEGSFAQGKTVENRAHPALPTAAQDPGSGPVDCDGCHNSHVWNPLDSSDRGDFFTPGDNSTSFLVSPSSGRSPLCLRCHAERVSIAGTKHDLTGGSGAGSPGLCEGCHLPHGGEEHLMWRTPFEEQETYGSEACLQCHEEKKEGLKRGADHPVGVTPGPRAGSEFPLYLPSGRKYFQGNVSCGTCHDPHTWSPLKGLPAQEEADAATSFLRMEADGYAPLCFPCHAENAMVVGTDHDLRVTAAEAVNLDGLKAEESGVCGSCHSVHNAKHQPFLWNREEGEGMDPQSRYCRSCHDEGAMEEAKVPPRLETHFVSYPGKGMVSRFITRRKIRTIGGSSSLTLYSPEGEKDSRGHISCATCHDPHRWEAETSRSGAGLPVEGDEENSFLKERSTFAVGASFCRECHEDDTLEMYRRYHSLQEEPAGGE